MPTVPTFSGEVPFEAGILRGQNARREIEDAKLRSDARFNATLSFQKDKFQHTAELQELDRLFREDQAVQKQANFETQLEFSIEQLKLGQDFKQQQLEVSLLKDLFKSSKPQSDVTKFNDLVARGKIAELLSEPGNLEAFAEKELAGNIKKSDIDKEIDRIQRNDRFDLLNASEVAAEAQENLTVRGEAKELAKELDKKLKKLTTPEKREINVLGKSIEDRIIEGQEEKFARIMSHPAFAGLPIKEKIRALEDAKVIL